MSRRPAGHVLLVSLVALLVSCGDQNLFMSPKTDTADMQISSAADGQIFASGKTVPLTITAQDTTKNRDAEIDVTLSTPTGESLWHSRTAAALNEQSPITLPPGLAEGLYRLDLVLYSAGEVVQKKSVSFFIAGDGWKITGIRSFPPVITSSATVMLKAEVQVPGGSNPYLRWSWKGKVIQKGLLASGLDQILWDAPGEGGVYTITVELFPTPPAAGSDFPFTSSLALSTDIIVSAAAARAPGRLGPPASFTTLLQLQASLLDSGAGAKKAGKTRALPIGTPEVVSLDNGFGYRLDGSTGIRIPWLAIPSDSGNLRPFTISLGVSFDDPGSANTIVSAASADGSFSLVISMNRQTAAPQAVISGAGTAPLLIAWAGSPIPAKQRVVLSLSIVALPGSLSSQWFLDGSQVSSSVVRGSVGVPRQEGSITIGGDHGFKGVVDEFGVYAQDAAGRPSTDPDLYSRAQEAIYGTRLVFADGFDGSTLPGGFSTEGRGQLAEGTVDLAAGALLDLPPVRTGQGVVVTAALSRDSGRAAVLLAQWEGSSAPATVIPLSADQGGFNIHIAANGQLITVPSPDGEKVVRLPAGSGSGSLLLKLGNPPEARSDLVVDSILALTAQ